MKSTAQMIDKDSKTLVDASSTDNTALSEEATSFLKKLKQREIYPPKFPALLKEHLQHSIAEKMTENPEYDLKKLVMEAVDLLPDWAPPKLFIETVTWVTKAWEQSRNKY